MKEGYYLIPLANTMTNDNIYINGKCLNDILKEIYPELYQRENDRVILLYSGNMLRPVTSKEQERYDKYLAETTQMYERMQVPQFLIAYGNDLCVKEILTGTIIKADEHNLCFRRATKEEAEKYYQKSNYRNIIINYFKRIVTINENPFENDESITAYISGKLNGQQVEGEFKGKIKIKETLKKLIF